MWTCNKCQRVFEKTKQPHSCQKVPVERHFKNKAKAKEIFNVLVEKIENQIGKCQIISLPCCIHLFGKYDFLAALPKKDKLEIRFSLNRVINSPRLIKSVPISTKSFKNCIDIENKAEIDKELIKWLSEAYCLIEKRDIIKP
jgi:hypothetical protein